MSVTLSDWMLYTMQAVFGLLILDFAIAFVKSFWKGTFSTALVLDYLKSIVYFVFPLNIILTYLPIDTSRWILVIFYFIGGLAIILKYILDIIKKFK